MERKTNSDSEKDQNTIGNTERKIEKRTSDWKGQMDRQGEKDRKTIGKDRGMDSRTEK